MQKEVSHLRSVLNGGAGSQDSDAMACGLLGSPGAFKWEGFNGAFSPLASNKRLSQVCTFVASMLNMFLLRFPYNNFNGAIQKKEIEVALVGAFRREKDKELAFQALTAENQAAMLLVSCKKSYMLSCYSTVCYM